MYVYTDGYTHTPGGTDSEASVYNAEDPGSIPGSGRSAEEGNSKSLQYPCLGNPMDRGAPRATAHGVTSDWDTTERLNDNSNNIVD